MNQFFTEFSIAPKTRQIRGIAGENAYLLEGETSALLIDSLLGIGNLREFCRDLTGLPVHLALTHGHLDHAGGSFDFGECFIHPEDIAALYQGTSIENRKGFVSVHAAGLAFVPEDKDYAVPVPLRTYPVYGGDVFDLGGRRVEVIGVPGHTRGTVVLLDRENRILFSGDACNTNTLLNLEGSTSIEEYQNSLRALKKYQDAFGCLWGGHGAKPLPVKVIDEALELCGKILNGTDAAWEGGFREAPYYYALPRENQGEFSANIAYRKDWLHSAPHKRQPPLEKTA